MYAVMFLMLIAVAVLWHRVRKLEKAADRSRTDTRLLTRQVAHREHRRRVR